MTNMIKKICCNCGHWNLRDGDELDIPIRCNHKDNPDTSSYAGAYCEHFTWATPPKTPDTKGNTLTLEKMSPKIKTFVKAINLRHSIIEATEKDSVALKKKQRSKGNTIKKVKEP